MNKYNYMLTNRQDEETDKKGENARRKENTDWPVPSGFQPRRKKLEQYIKKRTNSNYNYN